MLACKQHEQYRGRVGCEGGWQQGHKKGEWLRPDYSTGLVYRPRQGDVSHAVSHGISLQHRVRGLRRSKHGASMVRTAE